MSGTDAANDELDEKIWITAKEASGYLNVARSTVYKMVRIGKLPASHVGTHIRIDKNNLIELMNEDRLRY